MILSNKSKIFSSNTPTNNNINILFKIYTTYVLKKTNKFNKENPNKIR